MARIPCPECKKQISDTAGSCQKCGHKLTSEEVAKIKKEQQTLQRFGIGCLILLILVLLVVIIGSIQNKSKTSSSYQRSKILIDVDNLANQSAAYVDSVLGTPSEITPITKYPSMMPGEFRYYLLSDRSTANIQFYKDQAKRFTINFSSSASSPLDAAARCGFEIGELGGLQKLPTGRKWTRIRTANTLYDHVTVVKNSAGKYSVLQAVVF